MGLGEAILLIVGIILIVIGVVILNASADVETEEGSIEDTLMKVPTTLGWGLLIGGIILAIIGFISLIGIL